MNKRLFDLQYEKFKTKTVEPGKYYDVYVKDEYYDANIIIEFNGIRKEYDIDRDFCEEESIIVNASGFSSSS